MDELPPLGAPGQRLGRYELLSRLAVGGMAEVYLARAAGPGDFRKLVAVKRLIPQHALDPQLLRMFLDEARLMARLGHPNLPQVIDVSDGGAADGDGDGDVPFFVMEYVPGVDLRDVLGRAAGPMPIAHALAVATAVAAGLHHAHELRAEDGSPLEIVHRDVSPSNVLVSFDGGVKVTDFGVAKWLQQKSFTYQGQLKGKFAHMSPEQCRGEPLDRRSDVFALGTLLYEMTTGRPAFRGDSEYDLLSQIVSVDAPAPVRPGEDFPPELAAIIARSMRRTREDRHATAQELQLALEAFAREHRLVVSPVALAAYVESLFAARVAEWRTARARGPGANGGGGARANAGDRTATDAFARGQTLLSRPSGAPAVAEGPAAARAEAVTPPVSEVTSGHRRGVVAGAVLLTATLVIGAAIGLVAPVRDAGASASAGGSDSGSGSGSDTDGDNAHDNDYDYDREPAGGGAGRDDARGRRGTRGRSCADRDEGSGARRARQRHGARGPSGASGKRGKRARAGDPARPRGHRNRRARDGRGAGRRGKSRPAPAHRATDRSGVSRRAQGLGSRLSRAPVTA